MANTNTKKKTDTFQDMLNQREEEFIEKVARVEDTLATNRNSLAGLAMAAEASKEAMEDLEATIRGGDSKVTGLDLVAARADAEIASMVLTGTQKKIKRSADWLAKSNTNKDIAAIVKTALLERMLPGANAYATFSTTPGGLKKDESKPENLPALVVTQVDGDIGPDGVGRGEVRITWHRTPLHSPLDAERLEATLEAAGFQLDGRAFIGQGLSVISGEHEDTVKVVFRSVSDSTPTVITPASSVEGWDESIAFRLNTIEHVEAQGIGATILSTEENENIRTMKVRLSLLVEVDHRRFDARDMSPSFLFRDEVEKAMNGTRSGLGRCVGIRILRPDETGDYKGQRIHAAELTYVSRIG